jgi:hypothetical protein
MFRSPGPLARVLFALFAGLAALPAAAVDAGKGADAPAYEPYALAVDDWTYDPFFADDGVSIDRFAGAPGYYDGRKLVRLANGDVVVAGTVVVDGDDQLGLVRYSPSGRRQTWPSIPPAYARYGNQYIVFPNSAAPDPKLTGVADIKRYGGNLYVLATQTYRASNGLDKYQAAIVVFSEAGDFRGWWFIRLDDDVYNVPLAMDVSGNGRLTLVAGNSAGGLWTRLWTARYTIDANGVPNLDNGFGNGGASTFELSSSTSSCSAAALGGKCPISGVDIAHEAGLVVLVDPPFYVAFTKKYDNAGDHDPCIAAFSGSGQLRGAFNGSGVRCYPFDDAGSDHDDEAVAIDTDIHAVGGFPPSYVQDIYLLADVSRQYSRGTGLLRVDASSAPVTEFGGTGKLLWGGCGSTCTVDLGDDTPLALARSGNDIGVAGHWKPNLVDQPELTVLDAHSGAIADFQVHGIATGDANYTDIVADGAGFVAAGWARDGSSNRMFVTSRYLPQRIADDTIFRYGME